MERDGSQNGKTLIQGRVTYIDPSLGVLLRPEWAALAMSASTVTVTLNALLLHLGRQYPGPDY